MAAFIKMLRGLQTLPTSIYYTSILELAASSIICRPRPTSDVNVTEGISSDTVLQDGIQSYGIRRTCDLNEIYSPFFVKTVQTK